jgi:hypothetical protein
LPGTKKHALFGDGRVSETLIGVRSLIAIPLASLPERLSPWLGQ